MFAVKEQTALQIRRAFDQGGEVSAILEFKRHFPRISEHDQARMCMRAIVNWATPQPPIPWAEFTEDSETIGTPPMSRRRDTLRQ